MKILFATFTLIGLILTSATELGHSPITVTSLRGFQEPLVAIGGNHAADQDIALISAIETYKKRKSYEDVSALTSYLDANPQSPWKFSLLANLGIVYRKTGYYSKAVDAWEQAWALGKSDKTVPIQSLANQVAADLASLLSSLGRSERLDPLIKELKGRHIYGAADADLLTANEDLWLMKNKPGDSFKCGPYALQSILTFSDKRMAHSKLVMTAQSSTKGFSLTQVRDLSNKLKMNYQMAKRQSGAAFIVPSVAHWKSGHYAAILAKKGDYYMTKDPTFAQETLVTAQALEDETSGYFLVPGGVLPSGWQPVADSEGDTVWGRGNPPNKATGATTSNDKKGLCTQCCSGMARYNVFLMLDSLSIEDNPVGYKPPVGPDVEFTIAYNQLEASQPSTQNFSNFGACWNNSWVSYVILPSSTGGTVLLNPRGGGQVTYSSSSYSSTSVSGYVGYYAAEPQSLATLWVTSSGTYERRFPDGSKEIYAEIDSGVRAFLTSIVDPQGNAVTLQYMTDGSYRLQTITDALGITTSLTYGLAPGTLDLSNALTYLVTEITDPYARSATFAYSSSAPYELTSITDVIGITSSFTYSSGSVISQMTTPYGTTTFTSSSGSVNSYGTAQVRSFGATEPDGSEIAAESRLDGSNYPSFTDTEPTGSGLLFDTYNVAYISYRNTYFWDKKAMEVLSDSPESDYTKSHIYHFLHTMDGLSESPVLESEKPALENRIWYAYPGQSYYPDGTYTASPTLFEGTSAKPSIIARVISGSTQQVWQYQYDNSANLASLTAMIDPLGRQTNYTYDSTTGTDLLSVTQNKSSGTDTLKTITYDNGTNPPHCPATITDAAGETTSYTYNSQGQVLTVTPPTRSGHSAETTTYSYTGNYLTSITGPLSGATETITYDTLNSQTVNRVYKIADAEATAAGSGAFTREYTYDNLDRVTQITYPDTTTETFSYVDPLSNAYSVTGAVDLDLHFSTDRVGQTTYYAYDSTRHCTSMTDPNGHTTNYGWCSCGTMTSMTDANSHVTYFNRDVESRLTSKVYPGETQPPSAPDNTYDTVGRLSTFTDKRGDVATYSYNLDNTASGVSYSLASGTAATPTVSYGYDTYYPRLTSAGGVSISYVSAGTLGAEKPLTVTNTMTGGSAAITYTYDEWGRVVGRNIDSADNETTAFDSLGRVTSIVNALCPSSTSFGYSYFDPTHPTSRIGTISYPNGQSTDFNYFGITGDERLEEIKNLNPSSAVLSQNDYTYSADGKIATWEQQTDSNTPLLWTEGYDAANQLTSAVLTNTAITSPVLSSDSYGYDAVGNLTSSSVSGVSRSPSYNSLNQLTGSTPSGSRSVAFTGLLNEPATVTVNGSSATTNSGFYFNGSASLTPASTNTIATVPVVATDSHGNSRTNNYQTVVPPEPTYSPTFDADGNELTNGAGQTYTWDAKNELMSIVYTAGFNSGNHTEFAYDAFGRRIAIVERAGTSIGSGTVTSTQQLVWNGSKIAEERNVSNAIAKEFFAQGEQISGTSYYYTRDHLGSVREMTSGGTGTGSSFQIQARYDYDPYGRTTLVSGTNLSDFQYAGYYTHQPSGLNLTMFRAYDPNTAKWLSRDPLGEQEGPNIYAYVRNNPIDWTDPLGLAGGGHGSGYNRGPANSSGNRCPSAGEKLEGDIVGGVLIVIIAAPVAVEFYGAAVDGLDTDIWGGDTTVDGGAGDDFPGESGDDDAPYDDGYGGGNGGSDDDPADWWKK